MAEIKNKVEPIGYKSLTNTSGIAIVQINSEFVRYTLMSSGFRRRIAKARLRRDSKGNQYFLGYGNREYLKDYARLY